MVKLTEYLKTADAADLLLPKLISGKLDLEDLDINVGMTAEALEEATAERRTLARNSDAAACSAIKATTSVAMSE